MTCNVMYRHRRLHTNPGTVYAHASPGMHAPSEPLLWKLPNYGLFFLVAFFSTSMFSNQPHAGHETKQAHLWRRMHWDWKRRLSRPGAPAFRANVPNQHKHESKPGERRPSSERCQISSPLIKLANKKMYFVASPTCCSLLIYKASFQQKAIRVFAAVPAQVSFGTAPKRLLNTRVAAVISDSAGMRVIGLSGRGDGRQMSSGRTRRGAFRPQPPSGAEQGGRERVNNARCLCLGGNRAD